MKSQAHVVQASRVRVALYVALLVSAGVSLFGTESLRQHVRDGSLSPQFSILPAAVFAGALAIYAVDRVLLVRNRGYASGKAFFQVAFGLAMLTFLLPGGLRDQAAAVQAVPSSLDPVVSLLHHPEARVRALAAEVAGHRGGTVHLQALAQALATDPSDEVRAAAALALNRQAPQVLVNPGTPVPPQATP